MNRVAEVEETISQLAAWVRPLQTINNNGTLFIEWRVHEICSERLGLRAEAKMVNRMLACDYRSTSVEMMFRAEYDYVFEEVKRSEFGVAVYNRAVIESLAKCFKFTVTSLTADEVLDIHYVTMQRSAEYDDETFMIRNYERVISNQLPLVICHCDVDLRLRAEKIRSITPSPIVNVYSRQGNIQTFEACCDEERLAIVKNELPLSSSLREYDNENLLNKVRVHAFIVDNPLSFNLQASRSREWAEEEICSIECKNIEQMNHAKSLLLRNLPFIVSRWWKCAYVYGYDVSPSFCHLALDNSSLAKHKQSLATGD